MKAFKKLWFLLLVLYLIWILFFIAGRLFFMIYQFDYTRILSWREWVLVFLSGMKHDLSVAGYILLLNTVLLLVLAYLPTKWMSGILAAVNFTFLTVAVLTIAGDMELYTHWGFRLDATPLLFADHPKEMAASVSVWVILRQLGIATLLWVLFYKTYRHFFHARLLLIPRQRWITIPGLLITGGLLIIPIRGGFSVAPMNIGAVYFSDKPIANHAAVNVVFNLFYSLAHLNAHENPYLMMDSARAKKLAQTFMPTQENPGPELLNTKNPNILIVLLESFTAKAVESLGGREGITPNLDHEARSGILFSNVYSSGSRSDRGIVAVLSGYPALPRQGIMLFPSKTAGLPFLSKELVHRGYTCSFYYGGNIDFGGMRSYLKDGGFSNIVSLPDFGSLPGTSKWGVYDQFVFDTLLSQTNRMKTPFMNMVFTLTSHEPFELPVPPMLPGNDVDSKFLSSIHYTDSCLGDFLQKARKAAWWSNTLVVLVADHGSMYPGKDGPGEKNRYHIPMIWTGGAIAKDTIIDVYASQADIPATILNQMGMDHTGFIFSRNILSLPDSSAALFYYNDGFGYVSRKYFYTWDNNQKNLLLSSDNLPSDLLERGRAFQQVLLDDFISR